MVFSKSILVMVGFLMFFCFSFTSANRILKDLEAETKPTTHDLSSGLDLQAEWGLTGGHIGFKAKPIAPTVSGSGGCNYGNNCGQNNGYQCPQCPSYGCGNNCYTSPPCQWQGCPVTAPCCGGGCPVTSPSYGGGCPITAPSCGCVSCSSQQPSELQHSSTISATPSTVNAMKPTNLANSNITSDAGLD